MSGGMYGAGDPVPPAHDLAGGGRPEDGDVASSPGRERARDAAARLARRIAGPDRPPEPETWVAAAAAAAAAQSRARTASLHEQAAASATLIGLFVDLAERRTAATLTLVDGWDVRGVVTGAGHDLVVVERAGETVLVPLAAIALVRSARGVAATRGGSPGDRVVRGDARLGDVLGELAADRQRVALRIRGLGVVRGRLRHAGADLCELRPDGAEQADVVVATGAVTEVVRLEI